MRKIIETSTLALVFAALLSACKSSQTVSTQQEKPEVSITGGNYLLTDDNALYELIEQRKKEVPAWVENQANGRYNPEATRHFQLLNTELKVRFDWEKKRMPGEAVLSLSPHFYPQKVVVLDAKGFDLHKVARLDRADTLALAFSYDSLKLRITLDRTFTRHDTLQLFVRYTAKPSEHDSGGSAAITDDRGLYFINADGKNPYKPKQLWTQGETEASSCWFPTFDAPNAKTRQEIYITVDTAYTSISNGILVAQYENSDGTRTDYWKIDQPHAPYLAAMVVGKFAKISTTWQGKEVSYYVEPAFAPYAERIFGRTPEMLTFFSEKFGYAYPWDKYAQVVVRDFVSGAMENTSVSVFMEEVQVDDRYLVDDNWDDIIAHELSHHWFGNLVTCESWANLPLNEAFATYAEYLWNEHKYGRTAADLVWKDHLESYLEEAETKREPLIRFRYTDREDMFDSHSYAKGGVILHYLRHIVGDEAFFESLNRYLVKHAYQTAEVHDLRIAFEEVTGQDLNWFFEQWFMQAGHPELYVKEEYEEGTLRLFVTQQQDTRFSPLYRLPLAVDIWVAGKKERHTVEISERNHMFSFATAQAPDLVLLDAESVLPGVIDHIKTTEAFIRQYREADRIAAKFDAIEQLSTGLEEMDVFPVLLAALEDPEPIIREFTADLLANYEGAKRKEVAGALEKRATSDKVSDVRAAALNALASLGDYTALLEKALQDSSYLVNAYALYHLGKAKKDKALPTVERFEAYNNINIQSVVADFYSAFGISNKLPWFEEQLLRSSASVAPMLLNYLGSYLMNQPLDAQQKGVVLLSEYAKTAAQPTHRIAAFQSLMLLGDVAGVPALLKELMENEKDEKARSYFQQLGN